jgi:alpha-1,3-rhamnosyl/mannosyltransferase
MRVIVNRLVGLGRKTGIGHYTAQSYQSVDDLREQTAPDVIDEFPSGWLRRAGEAWAGRAGRPPGTGQDGRAPGPLGGAARACLRQGARRVLTACFRTSCARQCYDLYHEPNYIPLPAAIPTVATLHDLSVLLHPEWHPRDRAAHFERHFREGLAGCAHFLAISEAGRREIIRTLNIPAERVTRTYMGIRPGLGPLPAEEVAAVLRRLGLPPRYLLFLGTIEPRKNVLLLLRAYCDLPRSLRERWPLLLVGSWGWNTSEVADYFHRAARHRGALHVGYVAEEHLAAVYNGARALAYPSLYEGFGLPPIEMMACGGAVLASTAAALVETVGSRAHLIDAADRDGWRDALARVVTDDDWQRDLRRGAEELARPFTWDRCAADTLRVYRALCGDRGHEKTQRAA